MSGWRDLGNIWNTFRELDIRPIAAEAERPIVLAFAGAQGVGKSTLIAALRRGARPREKNIGSTIEADLDAAARLGEVDLIILILDAVRSEFEAESKLYVEWKSANRKVLVLYNKMDTVSDLNQINATMAPWSDGPVAFASALDPDSLAGDFVPRLIASLPDRSLALARRYPIVRLAVSRELINDTSLANATYSLGTGLAEVIPALNVPFNVTDIIILTKNQALMVYKLGLALGLSVRWQDHMAELGSVVGAGFLWRQVARQLVGLIPGWGIVPKVAIAYAGTYAVGEAVLRWYQTGHKVSGQAMKGIYSDALMRGRQVAQNLIARAPKPSLPRIPRPPLPALSIRSEKVCPNCGRVNLQDAKFCAYCGTALPTV